MNNMTTKIAKFNFYFGLTNKNDLVRHIITENTMDVLCLHELELEINIDHNLTNFPGLKLMMQNLGLEPMLTPSWTIQGGQT